MATAFQWLRFADTIVLIIKNEKDFQILRTKIDAAMF